MTKKLKYITVAAVNALLLTLIVICLLRCRAISGTLLSQQAAEFWTGESELRFAQVSCYFPVGNEKTLSEIRSFRDSLPKKLADAGVETRNDEDGWVDAYSTISTVTAKGERGSSEATAIGVGGSFFLFHPYELLSGSYISDDDVMADRVVIDRELAWKLFGGTQLAGMTMDINGKLCYIAGVIERETDKYSLRCAPETPLIFMFSSQLDDETESANISSYELVMLDPISGFAEKTLSEGLAGSNGIVVENSDRYSLASIFSIFKNFGERSISDTAIVYPYWENAARLTELYIARLYVIIALLAIFPLLCLAVIIVKLIKLLSVKLKELSARGKYLWQHRYDLREERRKKKAERQRAIDSGETVPRKVRLRFPKIKRKTSNALKEKTPKQKKNKARKVSAKKRNARKNGVSALMEFEPSAKNADESQDEAELIPDIESIVREVLENKQEN